MKDPLRKLAELALIHLATFAFHLVFTILCGRVLGLHDFGIVSFYTALAAFHGVIIKFGFDWLGIREVSQAADDPTRQHHLLCNVTAAKLPIGGLVADVTTVAVLWLGGVEQWVLVLPMVVYMLGYAMDVGWYLRALESTWVLLAITTAVRRSAIGLLWVLVSRPGDMSGALWTYAFVSVATSATAWVALSHRQLARFVRPQCRRVHRASGVPGRVPSGRRPHHAAGPERAAQRRCRTVRHAVPDRLRPGTVLCDGGGGGRRRRVQRDAAGAHRRAVDGWALLAAEASLALVAGLRLRSALGKKL